MQLHAVLFYAVQTGACLYAVRRGGRPERAVAAMMAFAALASSTAAVHHPDGFVHVERTLAFVDVLLLIGLVGLSLRADRYWPMYVAATQLLAVAVHGVRSYDPAILPIVYYQLTALAAYPMIVMLVVGTRRHCLRKMIGPERDWSPAL